MGSGAVFLLPEHLEAGDVVLRRWTVDDAALLDEAVSTSIEHLRPWMPWAGNEPQDLEQRAMLITAWHLHWLAGGDVFLGIFVGGEVAGGCGLHRRRTPDVLEVGYWLRPGFVGRGVATTAARLLTTAAFTVPGVAVVEIHHDKANSRSGAVPRRLGFEYAGEEVDTVGAPAETGVDCTWRMTRERWAASAEG